MSETETERRADHEVRQAVDNIQSRFLERVGDRVARGLSLRELGEELIIEALGLTNASYGCLLRIDTAQSLSLDAVVSVEADGSVSRQHDTLLHRQADGLLKATIKDKKATFSNNAASMLTANLPSCHPQIRSFALLPIREDEQTKALLFVANATLRFDLVLVNRLQSMLDAFIRVHINSIVNRGISNVIADIGQTSHQLITLLSASFNGVMTIDDHSKVTAFNPACEQMFGVETRHALGSSGSVFLPLDVLETLQQNAALYHNSLRVHDARPFSMDNVVAIKADGQQFSIDLSAFHTRIDDAVFTTLVINDISDRMQSAHELQATVEQYKTLTKLAPVGVIKLNEEWICEYANDMWCQLSSRSIEQNLDSGWIEAIHIDERARVLMDMRNALIEGRSFREIVQLNNHDGNAIWVSMNATGLLNSLNILTGSLVVIMDITERYLAEKSLSKLLIMMH